MPLVSFRRPPAQPPAPHTPELTPARAALQANIDAYAAQEQRLTELGQLNRDLESAQGRLNAAQAVLDRINATERERWRQWASENRAQRPALLEQERAEATAELAVALRETEAAKRAVEAAADMVEAGQAKLRELALARRELVRNVLLDDVRHYAEMRREAFILLATSGGALEGIERALQQFRDFEGVAELYAITKARIADGAFHDSAIHCGQRIRDRFAKLPDLLWLDATATIEIEDESTATGAAA